MIIPSSTINIGFEEEEIQDFALTNVIERELTDIEINRIKKHWYECEVIFGPRLEIMAALIDFATNNKDNQWQKVDEDYAKSKTTT